MNALSTILVSGGGRSGTTLLMQLLGSSPQVAFDRVAPFEHRYLTFLVRTALLARTGEDLPPGWNQVALTRLADPMVGPLPFPGKWTQDDLWKDLLAGSWDVLSARAAVDFPGATHYAEKTPPWLARRIHGVIPYLELVPIRDPRDVLASVIAFVAARGTPGFGMRPGEDPAEFADRFVPNQRRRLEAAIAVDESGTGTVVRYEHLVGDLDGEAERLGAMLSLTFDPEAVRAASNEMRSHMTSDRPEESVGRWRRDLAPELAARFAELSELMARVGYET